MTDDVPNFNRASERIKAVLAEENIDGENTVELLIDLIYREVVTADWDWDELARVIHLVRERWGCFGHRWYGELATEDDADFERQLRQINEEEDERKKARIRELEDQLTAARRRIAELGSTDGPPFDLHKDHQRQQSPARARPLSDEGKGPFSTDEDDTPF